MLKNISLFIFVSFNLLLSSFLFESCASFYKKNNQQAIVRSIAAEENHATVSCTEIFDALIRVSDETNFKLPLLKTSEYTIDTLPSGKSYVVYKYLQDSFNDKNLKKYLDNSIELVINTHSNLGHTMMRVGKKIYGNNGVTMTSISEFEISQMRDAIGIVISVPKSKIKEIQKKIDNTYMSVERNNIPPFDVVGDMKEIFFRQEDGTPYLNSDSIKLPNTPPFASNNKTLNGKIFEKDGNWFIGATLGVVMPLEIRDDKYFIQTFNCTTLPTYIFREFFNVKEIDFYLWPHKLVEMANKREFNKLEIDALVFY